MAEGRQRSDWNHTSLLAAIIANANRDPKKRPTPFSQIDFHPYERRAIAGPKRKKTAAELFAKLASFDGIQPQEVSDQTWKPKTQPGQQMHKLTRPLPVTGSPRP